MASTAVIQYEGDGWWSVSTPYQMEFIDELKKAIPQDMREWNPEEKLWLVHEDRIEETIDLAHAYFDVEVEEE